MTKIRQQATSNMQQAGKPRGKSSRHFLVPCCLHLVAFCLNQDSQDKMKQINQYLAMSRRGLNMYNPLQAERSWGYRTTNTFSELRSSSICKSEYKDKGMKGRKGEGTKGRMGEGMKGRMGEGTKGRMGESTKGRKGEGMKGLMDKGMKGRMGEGTKGRKVQATSISSWLACLLLVACCLLPLHPFIPSPLHPFAHSPSQGMIFAK
jgi:hypothetical protein